MRARGAKVKDGLLQPCQVRQKSSVRGVVAVVVEEATNASEVALNVIVGDKRHIRPIVAHLVIEVRDCGVHVEATDVGVFDNRVQRLDHPIKWARNARGQARNGCCAPPRARRVFGQGRPPGRVHELHELQQDGKHHVQVVGEDLRAGDSRRVQLTELTRVEIVHLPLCYQRQQDDLGLCL